MTRIDMPEDKHPELNEGDVLAYEINHGTDQQVSLARALNSLSGYRVAITTRGTSMLTELDALNVVDGVLDLLGIRTDRPPLAGARTELRQHIKRLTEQSRDEAAARKFRDTLLAIEVVPEIGSNPREWEDLTDRERAAWCRREQAAAGLYKGKP